MLMVVYTNKVLNSSQCNGVISLSICIHCLGEKNVDKFVLSKEGFFFQSNCM